MDVLSVLLVLGCTALVMAAEHYAAAWYTGGRMWPRVVSYVLGVLGVLGPVSGWLVWQWLAGGQVQAWAALLVLWLSAVVSGATVAGMYLLDAWLQARREAHEAHEREQVALDVALGRGRDADD